MLSSAKGMNHGNIFANKSKSFYSGRTGGKGFKKAAKTRDGDT